MYVVFGAAGQTGSAVADTLFEKKLPVCVVLRSDKAATSYGEMMRGFNSGHIVFENNAATETRRGETTIEDYAAEAV